MQSERSIGFLAPKPVNPQLPLFVYLPGMDCTGKLLKVQAERLATSFDLRCLSIPQDDVSNWDFLAEATIKLIQQELKSDLQRPVYLCGESFGGCLAIKTVLSAPWLIERLILVNPASSFNQRPWLSLGASVTSWLPDLVHRYSALGLLPFLAELSKIRPKDRFALLQAMRSIPQSVVSWRLSLLQNFRAREEKLNRLTQPTLIVASASDRLLPSVEEAQRLVNVIPNAVMTVLPKSGHACLLEADTDLYGILKQHNFCDQPQLSH